MGRTIDSRLASTVNTVWSSSPSDFGQIQEQEQEQSGAKAVGLSPTPVSQALPPGTGYRGGRQSAGLVTSSAEIWLTAS